MGTLEVEYNPAGRPGSFNKQITITTNGEPATSVVVISGEVVTDASKPTDASPVNEYLQYFPYNANTIPLADDKFKDFVSL